MKPVVSFEALPERLRQMGRKVSVAVASPADAHTEEVIERAIAGHIADFVLVAVDGKDAAARRLSMKYPDGVAVVQACDDDDAARRAVAEVRGGRAEVLMKGTLNTDNLLRAVLDKERGLLAKGSVLTHIAVADVPGMDRLLFFSDAAVIPFPTDVQLDAMVSYATSAWRDITGGLCPHVALTHCTEKTSEKFPVTLAYAKLCEHAAEGRYGNACVAGPMDVKTACDAESGALKGISSPVVGNADILIFPDIEAGNTFYKAVTCFAHATVAGMLAGTTAPVVVTSRADSADSKFYSLATACVRAASRVKNE